MYTNITTDELNHIRRIVVSTIQYVVRTYVTEEEINDIVEQIIWNYFEEYNITVMDD